MPEDDDADITGIDIGGTGYRIKDADADRLAAQAKELADRNASTIEDLTEHTTQTYTWAAPNARQAQAFGVAVATSLNNLLISDHSAGTIEPDGPTRNFIRIVHPERIW